MKFYIKLVALLARIFDLTCAFFLAFYAFLVIGPLGFLRGPLVIERAFWYIRVFSSMGSMAKAVRVAIDWRLGNFDIAIAQAEDVITQVEGYYQKSPQSLIRKRVLADLYTILTRAYMHTGHMDEAMQVVLRAKKVLDLDRLFGLVALDAKTAHLVRAGLAAGRLLNGEGLATMFVKTEAKSNPQQNKKAVVDEIQPSSSSKKAVNQTNKGAKIIPFPINP